MSQVLWHKHAIFDDQDVPLTLFVVNEKEKKEFVQANDTDPLID